MFLQSTHMLAPPADRVCLDLLAECLERFMARCCHLVVARPYRRRNPVNEAVCTQRMELAWGDLDRYRGMNTTASGEQPGVVALPNPASAWNVLL